MAVTTINSLPPEIREHYNLGLLSTPQRDHIHTLAAEQREMPENAGDIERFQRYEALNPALTPLDEDGETPEPDDLNSEIIEARVRPYGAFVAVTDQVTMHRHDPVLSSIVLRQNQQIHDTEDTLTRNMLLASAGSVNAANGLNGDVPTNISETDVNQVTEQLDNADAKKIMSSIQGENRFGTSPVSDAYPALASKELISSLRSVGGWTDKAHYPNDRTVASSEYGTIRNLRFFLSSAGAVEQNASANGQNVYDIIIPGMESYGIIKMSENSVEFIYKAPQDPLNRVATAGWKMWYASAILNDAWITRLRVTR